MEQRLIDFIFREANSKNLKPNEFRLLCTVISDFINEGKSSTDNIKDYERSMTYPTLRKTFESLAMLGYVKKKDTEGNTTGYEFSFLNSIIRKLESAGDIEVFNHEDDDYSVILNLSDREKVGLLSYKEILTTLPQEYKETLLSADFNLKKLYSETGVSLKKLYNRVTISVKKLFEKSADYKETLTEMRLPYKVSLTYLTYDNPFKNSNLCKIREADHSKIRQKLSKVGYIYNKEYIYLLDIIDLTIFGGNIFRLILKEENNTTETNEPITDKTKSKPFELTQKTIAQCPRVFQSSTRLIATYKKWLDYRRNQKKAPVGYYSAMSETKKLCEVEDPVETIEFSMRVSAKNLIFKEKEDTESKETGTGGGNFSII